MSLELTDRELAGLWRRQFECLDTIVHGYLVAEAERQAGQDPGPAGVTLETVLSARHALSGARYHRPPLGREQFKHSDPESESYVGRVEAEFRRTRNEHDAAFD